MTTETDAQDWPVEAGTGTALPSGCAGASPASSTAPPSPPAPPASLEAEARLLSRYLIGTETTPEVAARYVRACAALFPEPRDPEEVATVRFCVAHPWALRFLDAASGLLAPRSLLRGKLLLMMAILETATEHVELFTPRPRSKLGVLFRLALWGCAAVLKAIPGLALYPISRRAR